MKHCPHRTISLPRLILGATLFLMMAGTLSISHAREVKYFIKSNATTCYNLAQDMDAQNFPGNPKYGADAIFNTEVVLSSLALGDYPSVDPQVSITGTDGSTTFNWQAITGGFTLICVKAGNGRTCYAPEFDQLTQGDNYTDLNTTSNINDVYFCSSAENPPAYGGPDCPAQFSGESLYDLFNVLGNNHGVLTFFDGQGKSSTCGGPDPATNSAVYSNCSGDDAFAPIASNGTAENPDDDFDSNGVCDPTEETCCRIDNACAEGFGTAAEIAENCTLNVGGPTSSTGYSKGGDNTCISYGPSGDGSSVQICW